MGDPQEAVARRDRRHVAARVGDRADHLVRGRVDLLDLARAADVEGVGVEVDLEREQVLDRDVGGLAGPRVDARHGVVVQVRGPHRAAAERDVARALAQRDRRALDLAGGVAASAVVAAGKRQDDDERDDRGQRGPGDERYQGQLALRLRRRRVAGRGARLRPVPARVGLGAAGVGRRAAAVAALLGPRSPALGRLARTRAGLGAPGRAGRGRTGRGGRSGRPGRDAALVGLADHAVGGRGPRRASQVAGRRIAVLGLLGHGPGDDLVERRRHVRSDLAQRRRRLLHVGPDLGRLGVARVGDPPGEHLVEHAAERVDVRARVDRAALELLRRDVVERADEHAGLRHAAARRRLLGQAEVGQVGERLLLRAGDQHVRGLDVAVDEPARVGGVERPADLGQDLGGALGGHGALALDHRAQVRALDVAHRDVELPVLLARLVERDHVRVLDLRRDLRLVLEPLAERRVGGQVGRDQLQRHLPVQPDLGGAVDDPHPAPPGDRLEPVPGDLRADCCLTHRSVYSVRPRRRSRNRPPADANRAPSPGDRRPRRPARPPPPGRRSRG